ncbi:MAG TPA: hypothetical protein VNK52_14420 [Hyphomicrobiaceae bacterium]|nr:hypothetical protein [Hyphomicrobiaceae bacterium]
MTSDHGDSTRPSGGGSAIKRPSAIIDVKATALEDEATGKAEAAGRVEETAAQAASDAPSSEPELAGSLQDDAERGNRGSAPGLLVTHGAAGVAGGVLVLLAVFVLAPLLGQTGGEEALQDLERRLRAIETSPASRAAVPADLAQKMTAAEQRLARLEEAVRKEPSASEAQARLASQMKVLEERVGKLAPLEAARVAKLEDRLQQLSAAGIPAAAGREQIDREIAELKDRAARLGQRADALKADGERLASLLKAVQEDLTTLKADVAREFKSVVRTQDVNRSLAPVSGKLSALEQEIESLAKSELDRQANAERIVLALELGNLKRVLERGVPYSAELAEVSKVAGGKLNLAILERYKSQGVPPVTELAREFRGLAHAVIEADAEQPDASILDRLLAGAKSIVRIRKVSHPAGDTSVEAVVARMEAAVRDGNLALVIEAAKGLSPKAREPVRAWLEKVEARVAVDRAINDIDAQLKASLGGGTRAQQKG